MGDRPRGRVHRFRRRLTAVFVGVAAASAGVVAVVTFGFSYEYRWLSVRSASIEEARVAIAGAPVVLDPQAFERLRNAYEPRGDADLVAVQGDRVFSTFRGLGLDDVPRRLHDVGGDDAQVGETQVGGRPMLVVALRGAGDIRYYFFFSVAHVHDSLRELAWVSAGAWTIAVVGAGAVGHVVARATLRPVAATAAAAESIAGGDLRTRLPVAARDEFGALAGSFNNMADAVEEHVRQLARAAARERRFTADVAHELRTPLTGMSASAAVLRELIDELPAAARRPATVLVSDVDRFRELVFELLELSRLDAATEPVAPEPLRVAEALGAMCATPFRRDAGVVVDVTDDAVVLAEPRRLRRILGNLIDNAILHGEGPPTVRARREGREVVVEVVDSGPGIPEDELPLVFDRFYKSDRSRASGGSGLGLAIARDHARAQGGDVTAGNEPGRGACFTLRLPAADPAPDGSLPN